MAHSCIPVKIAPIIKGGEKKQMQKIKKIQIVMDSF
jgi:hypothetical protein